MTPARVKSSGSSRPRVAPAKTSASLSLPAHPLQHLLISLFDLPQILSEPILIHRLIGGLIPKPAGVRRDLIRQDESIVEDAKLQFEIDQQHLSIFERTAITRH